MQFFFVCFRERKQYSFFRFFVYIVFISFFVVVHFFNFCVSVVLGGVVGIEELVIYIFLNLYHLKMFI